MTVKYEKIEENKVKLTITVEAEEFNKALDVAFEKVVKDVSLPGFRKGKVPRYIFERRFGEAALYEEAINYLIPRVYPKAVQEANIQPVAQPEIDIPNPEEMGKDKPFTFTATVFVKPAVTLGEYKGIEVKQLSTEVTEEEVNQEIDRLLNQHAELVLKEAPAENGDTVIIDFEGFKDGVAFEGGKGTNYSLKLGSQTFIPGFEEQLIGIQAGEERKINVTFPEDYPHDELKGQEVTFNVVCHEVKYEQKPELNDDFVKELNRENINTVEELRNSIRDTFKARKEQEAKNHVIDTVVDIATNNAQINIPEVMIENEVEEMIHNTEHRFEHQGINLDLYLQYIGSSREQLKEQFKPEAEKRIRYNLTLEKIAEVENIQVSEDELNEELKNIADYYNMSVEEVKKAFPNTKDIEDSIKIRKAVDFLVDNAVKL